MTAEERDEEFSVLIVEDNAIDARMVKLALKNAGYADEPRVVDDGVPALALLNHLPPYEEDPLPDFIILDLNLRLVDGPEVLRVIRQTPHLAHLVVAVLSSWPEDLMRVKAVQADGYFRKVSTVQEYKMLGSQLLACYQSHRER